MPIKSLLQHKALLLCDLVVNLVPLRRLYSTANSNSQRKLLLKEMFKATKEQDIGQNTDNPYLLAMRHFNSAMPTTLSVLNSILAHHSLSLTQEEFDILKSIQSVSLSYPLRNNDPFVHSVVGPATKRKDHMVSGSYLLTVKDDGRQYAGGSSNLSTRLRVYYNTKAKITGRTMSQPMSQIGPKGYNLQVYVISFDQFSKVSLITSSYRAKLILPLEQYLILSLKPVLNDMLVVGAGLTKNLGPTLGLTQSATVINSKPLYVYDANKGTLLYISSSRINFQEQVGMNTKTQWKHITKGNLVFDTYFLTETPIEGAVSALMTTEELRESMESLYLSNKGPKHPVMVTDLRVPVSERKPLYFSSKTKALEYTVSVKRPVGKVFMANLPCTHNGWLVEEGE